MRLRSGLPEKCILLDVGGRAQMEAVVKVEAALLALKQAIDQLSASSQKDRTRSL